jgi:hypothetical protein
MQTEELLARINRLEKQSRWMQGIGLLAIALFVGGCLSRAAVPNEVRARQFVLVDESGKTRGMFLVNKDGPLLTLCDENKTERLLAGLWSGTPSLVVNDESGKSRGAFGISKGGVGLQLYGENGNQRGVFSVANDQPQLALFDENEKQRGLFMVGKGGPALLLHDENDQLRGVFAVLKKLGPDLVLFHEDGNPLFRTPSK